MKASSRSSTPYSRATKFQLDQMTERPTKITFAEMREQGVRGVVVGAMMSVDLSQGQPD